MADAEVKLKVSTEADTTGIDKAKSKLNELRNSPLENSGKFMLKADLDTTSIKDSLQDAAARAPVIQVNANTSKAKAKIEDLVNQEPVIRVDVDSGEVDQLAQRLEDLSSAEKMASAEADLLKASHEQLKKTGRDLSKEEKKLIKELKKEEKALRAAAKEAKAAQKQLRSLEKAHKAVGGSTKDMNKLVDRTNLGQKALRKSTRNSGLAMLEFARAFEDAQYGVRGVINNIPQLLGYLGLGAGLTGVISVATVAIAQLFGGFSHGQKKAETAIGAVENQLNGLLRLLAEDANIQVLDDVEQSLTTQDLQINAINEKLVAQQSHLQSIRDLRIAEEESRITLQKLQNNKSLDPQKALEANLELDRQLAILKNADQTQTLIEQQKLLNSLKEAEQKKLDARLKSLKQEEERLKSIRQELEKKELIRDGESTSEGLEREQKAIEKQAKITARKLDKNIEFINEKVKRGNVSENDQQRAIEIRKSLGEDGRGIIRDRFAKNLDKFEKQQKSLYDSFKQLHDEFKASDQGAEATKEFTDSVRVLAQWVRRNSEGRGEQGLVRTNLEQAILNIDVLAVKLDRQADALAQKKQQTEDIKKREITVKDLPKEITKLEQSIEKLGIRLQTKGAEIETAKTVQSNKAQAQAIIDENKRIDVEQKRKREEAKKEKRRLENAIRNTQAGKSQGEGGLLAQLPLIIQELTDAGRVADAKLLAAIKKSADDGLNKRELVAAQESLNTIIGEGNTKQLETLKLAVDLLASQQKSIEDLQQRVKDLSNRSGRIGR